MTLFRRINWSVVMVLGLVALAVVAFPEDADAYRRNSFPFERDLERLLYQVKRFIHNPPTWAKVTFCIIGAIALVYGYAIYQFIVMLPGMIIGGLLGFGLGAMEWEVVGGIIVGFIGLCLGGAIAWFLHQVAIFLIGAFAGGLCATGISAGIFDVNPHGMVLLIAGILGGCLLLFLAKALVIVKTSALGALLIMIGSGNPTSPLMFIVLFIIGMAVQFGVSRWLGDAAVNVGQSAVASRRQAPSSGPVQAAAPPPLPSADEAWSDDALHRMLVTLESNRDKVVEMLRSDSTVEEIVGYFSDHHDIPDKVTLGYLEELASA